MKNLLHRYICHVCRQPFDEPLFERCPNPNCRSYNWGDKDFFYAQLKAAKELKEAVKEKIQQKLEESRKKPKKKKKKGG